MFSPSLMLPPRQVIKHAKLRPRLRQLMPSWQMRRQVILSPFSAPPRSRPLCQALCSKKKQTPQWETKMGMPTHRMKRVTALAIVQHPPTHDQSVTICWKKTERTSVRCHHKELIPRMTAPRHIPRSPRLNEDQGQKQVLVGLNPKSSGSQ